MANPAAPKSNSTTNKEQSSTGKKSPRSLLGVDPYDVNGAGIDPLDLIERESDEAGIDPLDQFVIDPNSAKQAPQVGKKPEENEKSKQKEESNKKETVKIPLPETPKVIKDWQHAFKEWKEKPPEPKPPVTKQNIRRQLGAGYVGTFGGSVLGLFGGFVVGSLYGELAGCSRCWLDVATVGSVIGGGFLGSTGVYMFGNSEKQIGSMYTTVAASMIPVLLAEGFYGDRAQIRKSSFYLLTMPIFATLGYNFSRRYRKPGENPWIENFFIDDTWVSADPEEGIVAFNFQARF